MEVIILKNKHLCQLVPLQKRHFELYLYTVFVHIMCQALPQMSFETSESHMTIQADWSIWNCQIHIKIYMFYRNENFLWFCWWECLGMPTSTSLSWKLFVVMEPLEIKLELFEMYSSLFFIYRKSIFLFSSFTENPIFCIFKSFQIFIKNNSPKLSMQSIIWGRIIGRQWHIFYKNIGIEKTQ